MRTWIVLARELKIAYEITGEETARRFADYLTAEVGPAEVRPAEVGLPEDYELRDPVRELLTWRECDALPRMGDRQ